MKQVHFCGIAIFWMLLSVTAAAPQVQKDVDNSTSNELNGPSSTSTTTATLSPSNVEDSPSSTPTPTTTTSKNFFFPQKPTVSEPDIDRINTGVTTILNGIKRFDLAQILRGAFIFPKNKNVKKVANNVIDTIFGPAGNDSSSDAVKWEPVTLSPSRNFRY